jgi:hypothetical protein
MHPDIFTSGTYLIIVFLCLTIDVPLTVRHIFEDNHNWAGFHLAEKDNLRDVEIKEVNKMLSCKDETRGFFTYEFESCGTQKTVYFGCNSRICTNCGKNHTDKWAKSLKKALFNVPHRHAVLTIPDVLWPIVRNNRFLHKILMDAAIAAINDTISYKHRNGRLTAGAIVVLHPFSKSMGFNSHLHILVTEGGFDKHGRFVHQRIIHFKSMRRTWQYQVLTRFKAALPKNGANSMLIHQLFENHPEGFVVYLPKEARITNKQKIARYVARYIRHPAVANTRLHGYDGKEVTFWYEDREGKRHFVTMQVREFIKALIQHIPDRNFKMIRHYGAYSRRTKRKHSGYLQRSLRQATFEDFITKVKKWAPKCPNCGRKMTLVLYEKGPPTENEVFGSKLSDWNHPMLSLSYN